MKNQENWHSQISHFTHMVKSEITFTLDSQPYTKQCLLLIATDCLDLGYCKNSNNHMKKGGDVYVVKSEK